ncbi:MAG: hypothetical protein K8I82_00395 [Anaerolineae bacterium]|jgi:hypothetical protein|nr:hypothetical protein [Anaerolineae bacterium]
MKKVHLNKKRLIVRTRMLILMIVTALMLMALMIPNSAALAGWAIGGGY